MSNSFADVVIIGGAVMGSSIACQLAQRPDFSGRIIVVEADPSYQVCASARSAASIRQQFSSKINIEISLFGISYLRGIGEHLSVDGEAPTIDLHEGGYLFLATKDKHSILKENHELQQQLGANIAYFDLAAISERFPWLNTDGLEAGCHGLTGEGWFDGYGLMQAFRRKARSLGVRYVNAKATKFSRDGSSWAITLANGDILSAGILVNAAGASGGTEICRKVGMDVPVRSKKRCVFTFECRQSLDRFPLLIDPNGTYVRPEGAGYICGSAPPVDDPDCDDFEVEYGLFEEHIWPTLANRVPAFESIKPGAAWAGCYDMNLFDHNAFVGPVSGIDNFYIALGFSGHGLQQAPAVGCGLAEHIATGSYQTLDLSALGMERLTTNRPLIERNVV
ncbi:glycine/D-amino acid oxidase-like deaminating enzyme [Roseibium hamelinense]|uniref:Glycine/D-amino acid oxidase-like deaminating enzyme n=1 Tax=Roseibium hamelinense TaxID=150831 RepID=A0A562T158_9HYPH|nr:FAD-binding oxidoreductase [Roseibium hamelinense]MTI44711.1 FAD-binding oxidoreductase [Roseibium hamelinense]TWI87341.1 glycine/D-amino acid oxidase-like deaminating enzyme [Roseibium hamelinense]